MDFISLLLSARTLFPHKRKGRGSLTTDNKHLLYLNYNYLFKFIVNFDEETRYYDEKNEPLSLSQILNINPQINNLYL